jgi:hypothetical protein
VVAGDAIRLNLSFTNSKGILTLDKSVYTGGEVIELRLTDGDLEEETGVDVEVSSGRESTPQTVRLTALGGGEFGAAIPVAFAPPADSDGVLQIGPGVAVTATYADAFDGDGAATSTATAQVPTIILDNDTTGFTSTAAWLQSSFGNNYGPNKRYIGPNNPTELATWTFPDVGPGRYRLDFWVNNNNYAAAAAYGIMHDLAGGTGEQVTASQNFAGDGWHPIGEFEFSGPAIVSLPGVWTGAGTFVVADALQLSFVGEKAEALPTTDLWMIN